MSFFNCSARPMLSSFLSSLWSYLPSFISSPLSLFSLLLSSSSILQVFFSFSLFLFLISIVNTWKWAILLSLSFIIGLIKTCIGFYQGFRILIDLVLLVLLKFYIKVYKLFHFFLLESYHPDLILKRKMNNSSTYREWLSYANRLNQHDTNLNWRLNDENLPTLTKLIQTTNKLQASRECNDHQSLLYELPGIVKRNHLGIDDSILHLRLVTNTKIEIERYHTELELCLKFIADLPSTVLSKEKKIEFFQKLSRNIGNTALCLSGGGSLSMYHMGVLRALCESGNYKNIRVISGASGGSIPTAMCAVKTEAQLMEEVTVDDVSTDFKRTGEMKRDKIVWFPPLWKQAINFLKTGFLVESSEFQRTCQFYWGDITFQEAYAITHRHVCISVTSAASGGAGPRKLLLNHVSTPHVLIRSAVAASCALPGIMAPNALLCRISDGSIVPFEVDGVDFIDGSVQADVPFRRMAALFSVSNFIVSQVNVHVLPFIEYKLHDAIPSGATLVRSALNAIDLDIRHRSLILATMGVLPKLYGQDMSALFKQRYHGDVTIVPDMKIEESLGIKAIMHPSKEDMQGYIRRGRKATWPHLRRIQHLLHIESCIWSILESLLGQSDAFPGPQLAMDSIPSQTSRPPFRRDVLSVSNLLVYPPNSSSASSSSPSPSSGSSLVLSLAETFRREEAISEGEQGQEEEVEQENDDEVGEISEKQRIKRRMSELESEYRDLQRRLSTL